MIHKIAERLGIDVEALYNNVNVTRDQPNVTVEVRVYVDKSGEVQNDYLLIPQEHMDSNESGQLTGHDRGLSKIYLYVPKYGYAYLNFTDGTFLDQLIFHNELHTYHEGSWIVPCPEPCTEDNFDRFMACLMIMIDLIVLSP